MRSATLKNFHTNFAYPRGTPDTESEKNIILSKTIRLGLGIDRDHIFVCGGTKGRKEQSVILPNILQAYGSYAVIGPNDSVLTKAGKFLEKCGYQIRVFAPDDPEHSMHYNPFRYLHNEQDVEFLIDCLTTDEKRGEAKAPLFERITEKVLLRALIYYLLDYRENDDKTFFGLQRLLDASIPDETGRVSLNRVMCEVQENDADARCVKWYQCFRQAPSDVRTIVQMSIKTRLIPYCTKAIAELTAKDEMHLEKIGEKKTAVFFVTNESKPMHPLSQIMAEQIYYISYNLAQTSTPHMLKYPVRILLSDFCVMPILPELVRKMTIVKDYGISYMLFADSMENLKHVYGVDATGILSCCGARLYLDGYSPTDIKITGKELRGTLRYISLMDRIFGERSANQVLCLLHNNLCVCEEPYPLQDHPNSSQLGDRRLPDSLFQNHSQSP